MHSRGPARSSKTTLCDMCRCRAVEDPGETLPEQTVLHIMRDKCQAGLQCQSLGSAAALCMALRFLPGVFRTLCSTWTHRGRATVWISSLEPWPWKMVQIMFNGC